MRIEEHLYFAPGIRFEQVDLEGPELPNQFQLRITGFYIDPAEKLAQRGDVFASGVLLVCCLDAMARFWFGGGSKKRFISIVNKKIESFINNYDLSERFYNDVRCGLVHESRIKNRGEFSLDFQSTIKCIDNIVFVNPKSLAQEVRAALDSYVDSFN